MARASRLHREGQGFESLVAHQIVFAGVDSRDIIITILAGAETDRICDLPPFIVTGASASGKTTLIEQAIAGGYTYIPTHTTRPPRPGEVPGTHGVFLNEEQFKDNFRQGLYIEGSLGLEFAYMPEIGVYYVSPRKQVDLLKKNGFCSSPVSTQIARMVFSMCGCNMKWLHLECDDATRRHRLEQRGMAPDEIEARMTFGDSLKAPGEAIVVDTSRVAAESLFGRVKQLLGRD